MLLIRERLWPIVSQRKTRPVSNPTDDFTKEQLAWDDEAERATATIFLYLDDSTERHVQNLRDPVELWQKLKDLYGKAGFSARYLLFRRLFSLDIRQYKNMGDYVNTVRAISHDLKDAGHAVDDEVLTAATLYGLDGTYETFAAFTVQRYRRADDISFDDVVAELLDESRRLDVTPELRQKIGLGFTGPVERGTALAAYKRGRITCWHCKKLGHREESCWTKYPEQRPAGGAGQSAAGAAISAW